ncbi:unnamed protein product [Camellia sinensis]
MLMIENIEKLAAKDEQPQEESSDSETTVFDNMPLKNFLEIVAARKCQKEGELAFVSQTAFGSTTFDRLQQSPLMLVDDAHPSHATAVAGSFAPLISEQRSGKCQSDQSAECAAVATAIVPNSVLLVDASRLGEQSDGLFSSHEVMQRHDRLIKAADKLKLTKYKHGEKMKELELRLVAFEGKTEELEKKLQTMDTSFEAAIKATKKGSCNEATTNYKQQFIKLENILFKDRWMAALRAARVQERSNLMNNMPYPCPEALEKPNEEAARRVDKENPYAAN